MSSFSPDRASRNQPPALAAREGTVGVDLRMNGTAPVRVASVPATHVYVRRLEHPAVRRLADPSGDDLRTPCFLVPEWVRSNCDRFDVLHVHFGFEFYDPSRLAAVCEELSRQGKPLVFTAHDLRNPNHASPELHDAGLEVWMEWADEVVTLTTGAAKEILRRYGRRATVIPHPHVLPMEALEARQRRARPRHRDRLRVGIHFKSLRANMVGVPLLEAALDGVRGQDGVRLRIDMHCDVVDPASRVHDPGLLSLALEAVAENLADLHVHNYFSDDELWDYLESVDAVVLPYRFGTHSGLLEACRDLGTSVIAPSCGYYAEQGAHHVFEVSERDGPDGSSVVRALHAAARQGRPAPIPHEVRALQRTEIAEAQHAVYRRVLAARGASRR